MSLVQNIVYSNPTELLILLFICSCCCYSVTKSCLTPCEPHELQQALLLCPSLSHGVYSNSCPLSQGHHPTILSSVTPFFCPQFLPGSGFFPMNQLFTTDGQSIVALALAPALPMNIQGWFPLGLTGLIILISKGLSRVLSSTTVQNYQFFVALPSLWSNSHNCTWQLERA